MLPILYEENSRLDNWQYNGIGTLRDTISCNVTENLSGVFEVDMIYPTNGWKANEIKVGRQLKVVTRYEATPLERTKEIVPGKGAWGDQGFYAQMGWRYQVFIIYSIDYSLEGALQVKAYHWTYKLNEWSTNVPLWGYGYRETNAVKSAMTYYQYPSVWFYWFAQNNGGFIRKGEKISSGAQLGIQDSNGASTGALTKKSLWTVGDIKIVQDIGESKPRYPWTNPLADLSNNVNTMLPVGRDNLAKILLGDEDSSLKNAFGLEVLRDREYVILKNKRSMKDINEDPIFIQYGRDLSGFRLRVDNSEIYTHIRPYIIYEGEKSDSTNADGFNTYNGDRYIYPLLQDGTKHINGLFPIDTSSSAFYKVLELDVTPWVDGQAMKYGTNKIVPGSWNNNVWTPNQDAPIQAQRFIEQGVYRYLAINSPNYGKLEAEIDFIHLPDVQETKHLKALQVARLGDPVMIDHQALGYRVYSKVSETNFNVLSEKYDSIKLESHVVPVAPLS